MFRSAVVTALALPLLAATPDAVRAQQPGSDPIQHLQPFVGAQPTSFPAPEELVTAFRGALAAGSKEKLAALLGLAADPVLASTEIEEALGKIREAAAKSITMKDIAADRRTLLLGDAAWPFPFPIVQSEGKWSFDTLAGLEEIVNRRLGENELTAIGNMRAYVDAQEEYRQTDWDEDGVAEYAQKLISSPGTYDGLYWEEGDGVPESPAGDGVSEEKLAGTVEDGYFGYRYRILTGQGENIAGGQHDYLVNGNMINGFALIATPAHYQGTGVMTFVVNQHGTVYEKDLGPETAALAAKITSFDPDESWAIASDPGD